MFTHNPWLAGATGLMGQLSEIVGIAWEQFGQTMRQRDHASMIDVAAISQIFDTQEHSPSSPAVATYHQHTLHYNHDDSLSEGESITSSAFGPDEDTASLSASTPSIERPSSYGINPSPAELVWSNDLCMSEIYGQMGKGTLVECLVLSKDNVERVAKELYRSMERERVMDMFESGCDLGRLGTMLRYVKTLQITEDEWKKYGAAIESPLLLFPQLKTLEIWDELSRRLYAETGYDPGLIIQERLILPSRLVLVRKGSFRTEEMLFPPTEPGSATTSISTISAVWIRDWHNGYTTLTNLPYRDRLMASIIFHVRTTLAARSQNPDSVFANLNTFVCKHSEKIEADDLVALLSVCPKLVELSVDIKEDPRNADKIGPALASRSDTLKLVTLGGAAIEWISSLRKCHQVSLTFRNLPSTNWLHEATDEAVSSPSQDSAMQYLILQSECYFAQRNVPVLARYLARYLEVTIGVSTEVIPTITCHDVGLTGWVKKIRFAVKQLGKEKAKRIYDGPGFRLIETAPHASLNSDS